MVHTTTTPRVLLLEDHRHIDMLLDRLCAAVRAEDREAMQKRWMAVERVLLKHLDVEETLVFPALRKDHEPEVDALSKEHTALRQRIGELGLALELHTLRCETIESFCSALRDHAAREDAVAYAAADRVLPANLVQMIAARVKETLSALRQTDGKSASTGGSRP